MLKRIRGKSLGEDNILKLNLWELKSEKGITKLGGQKLLSHTLNLKENK
jgi:hypothetical protein